MPVRREGKVIVAKLLSHTGNSTVEITPDGVSIIFRSTKDIDKSVFWPTKDWPSLKKFIDGHAPTVREVKNKL
jgi:hypothetical protein